MADETARWTAPGGAAIGVTGATGFVGRHVAAELIRRGYAVRALTRDLNKARSAFPAGSLGSGPGKIEVVLRDAFNDGAMRSLTRGAFALVHLIGIRRETRGVSFRRTHVEATRRALDAAREGGCARFLHMSALGVRPGSKTEYQRTKHEAEVLVRESGLGWTIFRPSLIVGPGGEFAEMVRAWATRKAPPYVFMPYFERVEPTSNPLMPVRAVVPKAQPVHVADVAFAFAEALGRGQSVGEVYTLGGPEAMAWPDVLIAMRDATPGALKSVGPMALPAGLGVAMARGAALVGLADALPFGPSDPEMASEDNVCSNAKAREHLGFSPRRLAASE